MCVSYFGAIFLTIHKTKTKRKRNSTCLVGAANARRRGKGEFGRLGQGDTNDWSEPEEIEFFRDIVEAHPEQAIASVLRASF